MASATRTQVTIADVERKFDEKHDELSAQMEQMRLGMEEIRCLIIDGNTYNHRNHHRQESNSSHDDQPPRNPYLTRISKVEFPKFNGKGVKEWLYKCDQFFLLDGTSPESKVRLASIHLDGLALQWHLNYMRAKFDIYPKWQVYVTDVMLRFGAAYEDPLSSLIQVKQTGKVQEYNDEFELALTQVSLLPEHALSIFLTGMEHTTQMQVRMFNPTSISHAVNLAKLHEASQPPKTTFPNRTNYTTSKSMNWSPRPALLNNPAPQIQSQKPLLNKVPRTVSSSEMADRRAKGLCMFCDEPFTPGHHLKHWKSQILVMELDDEDCPDDDIIQDAYPEIEIKNDSQNETPQLSLNAMTGLSGYQTIRVTGMHNKKLLQILLDSGSTHNFLDLEVAKKLGCKLENIQPMIVTTGGGNKLEAPFICKGFSWQLQQSTFTSDVIVLPLGCCDLILGIQWLKSLGPILWDFNKLQMEFSVKGKKFLLRGAKPPSLKFMNNKSFSQAVQQGAQLCFLYMDSSNIHLDAPSCQLHNSTESPVLVPTEVEHIILKA